MYTIRRVLIAVLLILVAPPSARAQSAAAPLDTSAAAQDTIVALPVVPATPAETVSTPAVARAAAPDVAAAPADSVRLIAQLLQANGAPAHRARPAAAAVMKYARLRALDPLLLVGIIGVENAELVPRSRSHVGATGVMQVMPFWKKYIRDCGTDLRDVATNVCFGTRILRIAIDESQSLREALLRYNGCVKSPGCHRYAAAVFSQTGKAMILSRLVAPVPPSAAAAQPTATVAGRAIADAGERGT
jgi:soluble lytic murein transglycosylase-like protein